MKMKAVFAAALLTCGAPLPAAVLQAASDTEINSSIAALKDGDTLRIAPGDYTRRHSVTGIASLTIEALDPAHPPHFKGDTEAWHFSRCPALTLRHLKCSGQTDNGINLDDGGRFTEPVNGIRLENLIVSDIGPDGNFDAIKCSGLDHFTISHCEISGWGGQAIDLVGCHEVLIRDCRFTGKPGFSQHTGPQFKGGCQHVTIEKCTFKDAGPRPIQVGGSTGLDFFRPPGAKYEAADIVVRDNLIEGGECACAFTGVDGAEFTGNTILRPSKWIFRILQENTAEGFKTCGNVAIRNNTITFRRSDIGSELNIGAGTAPASFRFEGNHWLAEDQPAASKPNLPVKEKEGVYGER
ncbi:MAG: hypothetical protein JWO82_2801 [Akkermansiaceae bacterium]|nr:hypothetical protein [Akkermansiaceae bacterium]